MVHGAHEMHVEDEWYAACCAKASIGKSDAIRLDILSGRSPVGVGDHDRCPNVLRGGFATVDPDDLAGDEGCFVRSEEHDGVGNLFRLRTAFERYGSIEGSFSVRC